MPGALIRVGTCAWSDHAGFYPPGLPANGRLGYYAQFFPLVEVDSTFYHPASGRNCALWAQRTPESFRFHLKVHRSLTWHDKQAIPTPRDLPGMAAALLAATMPLWQSGKLICFHAQFPPWFVARPETERYLAALRESIPERPIAVEFRHRSWFRDPDRVRQTLGLLQRLSFAHTVCDEPQIGTGSVPPVLAHTTDLALVRLHGRNAATWYAKTATSGERFHYRYSPDELQSLATDVHTLAASALQVHVLFNNNHEDDAVRNAAQFAQLLRLGYTDPWEP